MLTVLINLFLFQYYGQTEFLLDYTKANKNRKQYYQVPQNELIWSKEQALEPMYFFERPLKGHGWIEPMINEMINQIKNNKINLYVDYFTIAKAHFYSHNGKYENCHQFTRSLKIYRELLKEREKANFLFNDAYEYYSIPFNLYSPVGKIGIVANKLSQFEKHIYPGTNVYNVKSILDDADLKTIQITAMASAIKQYIYKHPQNDLTLKAIYKKHVYDFVASNAIQATLMLRGKRMDCAPRSSGKGNVVT